MYIYSRKLIVECFSAVESWVIVFHLETHFFAIFLWNTQKYSIFAIKFRNMKNLVKNNIVEI